MDVTAKFTHLGNFIKFLKQIGIKHRIQHLALAFSKEHYDHPNAVKTATVTSSANHETISVQTLAYLTDFY